MKKILFGLFAITSLIACKKSDIDPNNSIAPSVTAKIKTVTIGPTVVTYIYDAQGRISKQTFSGGNKTEYEYLAGIVKQNTYDNTSALLSSFTIEMNTDGTEKRVTLANDPNYELLYFYNADKTVAKRTGKLNATDTEVEDFFYTNGNLDSVKVSENNILAGTSILSYYTDKPNVLSNDSKGLYLLYGKDNKNMLKSVTYRHADGTIDAPAYYYYEYDAQGRVTKQSNAQGATAGATIYSYY